MADDITRLVWDWVEWLRTRRFYHAPLPPNMLALLAASPGRSMSGDPDAMNSAMCAAFNLVITSASDSDRLPFLYVYLKAFRPKPIKALASDLGIDRDTIYWRARQAATKFRSQAIRLAELNASMRREIEDYLD